MKKARKTLIIFKRDFSLKLIVLLFCYFILRFIVGPNAFFIYILVGILFLFRYSFEKIAFIFLFLSIATYLFGLEVEANRYMSFVYVFFVIAVLKHMYVAIVQLQKNEIYS